MKNTKNLFLLITVLILTGLQACKYEDGPAISLRSKKARAANTWEIEKAFENDVDKTDSYKNSFVNYKMVMEKNGDYTLTYRPFNISDYREEGSWKFDDNKNAIAFTPKGKSTGDNWKILRLKEHEAWIIQKIDGEDVELHMKD